MARENEFYVQLLQDALPPDLQHIKNMNTAAAQAAGKSIYLTIWFSLKFDIISELVPFLIQVFFSFYVAV